MGEVSTYEQNDVKPRVRQTSAKLAPLLLILILVVGSLLRIGGIGAESLWYDETLTAATARAPLSHVCSEVRSRENAPPLYFVVINVWSKVFGPSDISLRLPSALFGIATVALLHRLGLELFDDDVPIPRGSGASPEHSRQEPLRGIAWARRPSHVKGEAIALTAAALLAVSPIHIAYSQEARSYAMLVLLLLLCTWSFTRLLKTGSTQFQLAYVLTAATSLYTHTFAAFTLLALNAYYLYLLLHKLPRAVNLRPWIVLQLAILLLFGPWLPATIEVARMGLPWMLKPTPLTETMQSYAGTAAGAIVMVILIAIACYRALRERDHRIVLLLFLALIPVVVPIVYGTFTPRYGLPALIGLTLLAACGAASLGRLACVAIVLLAAGGWLATSSFGHARYPGYTHKIDVRSAADYVLAHARQGDAADVSLSRPIWHAFAHYTRDHPLPLIENLETAQQERIWLAAPIRDAATAAPGFDRYEILSEHAWDGVILFELRRRSH